MRSPDGERRKGNGDNRDSIERIHLFNADELKCFSIIGLKGDHPLTQSLILMSSHRRQRRLKVYRFIEGAAIAFDIRFWRIISPSAGGVVRERGTWRCSLLLGRCHAATKNVKIDLIRFNVSIHIRADTSTAQRFYLQTEIVD